MKLLFICLFLFTIEGCSHSQYPKQQDIAKDLLQALHDGDTTEVKQLISNKVDNVIPTSLFKFYIKRSYELLNKYGVPQKDTYKLTELKNDPFIEFDVPILNEQQKKVATIQIFFAKFLPEDQVYFFRMNDEMFNNRTIEAPKQK